MKFTKRQKILGTITLVIIVLITGTKIYFRYENIRVALEFGHLAKLPENSKKVQVATAGGFFSRTFWLTFESTPEEIDQWIGDSKQLTRKEDLVEGELYEVSIEHEALYGKIWVDRKNNKVYVRTSYS